MMSTVSIILMAAAALFVLARAKFAYTRRIAALPAVMCLMEMMGAGVLHPAAYPVLTAILWLAKLTVLFCCAAALRQDAAAARAKAKRREKLKRDLRAAMDPPLKVMPQRIRSERPKSVDCA